MDDPLDSWKCVEGQRAHGFPEEDAGLLATQWDDPATSGGRRTLACIGLGSNLGDRVVILDAAIAGLAGWPGVEVCAVSAFRETPPVGGPGGQPAFLNAAAVLATTLEPEGLLRVLNEVEDRAGRVRAVRWGERTLDLDLLLFGGRVVETPGLVVPHPRMAIRRFVLGPLAEIAPTFEDPRTGRTVAQLLTNLDRRPSYLALLTRPAPDVPTPWAGALAERLSAVPLDPALGLDGDRWSRQSHPERWRIADFWFDEIVVGGDPVRPSGPVTSSHAGLLAGRRGGVVAPTLAVASRRNARRLRLGEPDCVRPGPIGRDTPLVVLDSDEPRAAVEEVLAACAATRAG